MNIFSENKLRMNMDINLVQGIINNIDVFIAIFDEKKRFMLLNQLARQKIVEDGALNVDELIGSNVDDVMRPIIVGRETIVSLAAEKLTTIQKNIQYKTGTTIFYTAIPILEHGNLKYIMLTGRNMADLIQKEEQLVKEEQLNRGSPIDITSLPGESCGIKYASKKMEDVLKIAKLASQTDASVFITGESGVGKEMIAKYIHTHSARKNKKFMAINCAALPKDLIESELFGYAEGSFTGSRRGGKKGLLEEASGGTVFLDEIGELPMDVQSKLLRVVQESSVRSIGSVKDIEINVRYICATNLEFAKLYDNDIFRQDLLYRLMVLPIHIPPIRERREDIIPLIREYLTQFNLKYERYIDLTASAYDYLYHLQWPGNAREIKNVVERLVILSPNGQLTEDETSRILSMNSKDEQLSETNKASYNIKVKVLELTTLGEAKTQVEKQLIEMAIAEHGSVVGAAKALGVPTSTIYRSMKK